MRYRLTFIETVENLRTVEIEAESDEEAISMCRAFVNSDTERIRHIYLVENRDTGDVLCDG